jgi:hypothetical protein
VIRLLKFLKAVVDLLLFLVEKVSNMSSNPEKSRNDAGSKGTKEPGKEPPNVSEGGADGGGGGGVGGGPEQKPMP